MGKKKKKKLNLYKETQSIDFYNVTYTYSICHFSLIRKVQHNWVKVNIVTPVNKKTESDHSTEFILLRNTKSESLEN